MYVKHLELTRFKSFGSSTGIPLLPGFTVISGPNGSGKSNLLDALLFALGLSTSRGMRAEKLLDLVNSASLGQGKKKIETAVSVIFALGSQEWKVTRRLRVSLSEKGEPNTTSTFYINDVPCSLTDLHEQLEAMHIYPNGYNVVLQGDVTHIISMNAKERRQIIDELAGVANFDRKIGQCHSKLEAVKEQIDRYKLIEQEWQDQSDRLAQESEKARQYQALRQQKETLEQQQLVLVWRHLSTQVDKARQEIQTLQAQQQQTQAQIHTAQSHLAGEEARWQALQHQIQQLGESDYLQLKSQLLVAQSQQHQGQQTLVAMEQEHTQLQEHLLTSQQQLDTWQTQGTEMESHVRQLHHHKHEAEQHLEQQQRLLQERRERLQVLAQSADNWIQQHQYFSRQIEDTQQDLEPLKQEAIRLGAQHQHNETQLQTVLEQEQHLEHAYQALVAQQHTLQAQVELGIPEIQALAQQVAEGQQELSVQQSTSKRLQNELFQHQRQLDKLETRQQVHQEQQGSRAAQLILSGGFMGVCGLVAQLGQVDPRYQVALEIAAGNRLNFMVVEDSITAELAIELLKREKAGRITFLPLDKMQSARPLTPLRLPGLVDYALRLVDYDARFRDVFAFVFGQTLVMEDLPQARPQIGKYRMVTLEGELLETSGAMTGGSVASQGHSHFQASANHEIATLKERITDVEAMLMQLHQRLQSQQEHLQTLSATLTDKRQQHQHQQHLWEQNRRETEQMQQRLEQTRQQRLTLQHTQATAQERLDSLAQQVPVGQHRLDDLTQKLRQLEQSSLNQYWQQAQQSVQEQESLVNGALAQVQQVGQQIQHVATQRQVLHTQMDHLHSRRQEWQQRQQTLAQEQETLTQQQQVLAQQIQTLVGQVSQAEARLGSLKQERDQQEWVVKQRQQDLQRWQWEDYQANQQIAEKEQVIAQLHPQVQDARQKLPEDLPPVPESLTLDEGQRQQRRLEDKLRAMEPVNMLAMGEYESLMERLTDLRQKLETLSQERTELLLRIENFATLRQQAFMEAFQAVDEHFRSIFAQLSDGDGYLSLENPQDPLSGGLTLVAHPKGKPVRHLASMSGGEKSLTALSFIFALQRFRPSSFYAFDEVDMFLDGANVEKLAAMIQQQAQQAQFMVVSLRRPMIEKADRTIGVTQARGATTQVIGLSLR